jgi:hypothetical protein
VKRSNAPAIMTAQAAKGMLSVTCGREDSSSNVGDRGPEELDADSVSAVRLLNCGAFLLKY